MHNWFKNDFNKLKAETGWSFPTISDKTGVPLRTLESWSSGDRTPPDYVARLFLEKLKNEIKKESDDDTNSSRVCYRIVKTSAAFKNLNDVVPGASLIDESPEIIYLCENREEAYNELNKYKSYVQPEQTFYGSQYVFTEWHVEEYEGDETGEFISGSNFDSCKMFDDILSNGFKFVNDKWVDTSDSE